jgi:cation transport ATPase
MKSIKKYQFAFYFLLITNLAFAQTDTVMIHTSAICKQCKASIEKTLNFEKGVQHADLNVSNKVVTVIYKTNKTNPEKLRLAITNIGYDADSLKADPKAYDKLHSCCKKEGHNHE